MITRKIINQERTVLLPNVKLCDIALTKKKGTNKY